MAEPKGINLDDLMASLDNAASPEQELIQKIAGATPKPEEEKPEEEKKADEIKPEAEKTSSDEDLLKQATETDAQGRIIARAFVDELGKLAVGDVGFTPNPAAEGDNPAIQLSNKGGIGIEAAGAADAVIQSLTASTQIGGPQGIVGVVGGAQQGTPGVAAVDNAPLAADVAKAQERAGADKMASDKIVGALYKKFVEDVK